MNVLFIDTSSNKEIRVGLKIAGKKYWLAQDIDFQKAQIVLPLIDKLLKRHKLSIQDIDRIEVNTGPGSFTGLRVGISVANTLAWVCNIPINGKKQHVLPSYD